MALHRRTSLSRGECENRPSRGASPGQARRVWLDLGDVMAGDLFPLRPEPVFKLVALVALFQCVANVVRLQVDDELFDRPVLVEDLRDVVARRVRQSERDGKQARLLVDRVSAPRQIYSPSDQA